MKNFAQVERDYVRKLVLPEFDWTAFEEPSALNPLRVPVTKARVALVTTAGAYLKGSQAPFERRKNGDPSFRELPADTSLEKIGLAHVGYDTKRAMEDPNVVFPLDRLREAAGTERIGEVAPRYFSFMGYSPDTAALMENAHEVARRLLADRDDLILLVPA